MKKIYFLVIILFSLPLFAQNETLFEEGNTAYNEGDYATAINKYEQILENGETSSEVYYNLGNAHFKANNLAPSIYYYEKGLQLNPNDTDLLNNRAIAQNMVIDDVEGVQETGAFRLWNEAVSSLGYNEWAWIAITFAVFFAILFLLYYISTKSGLKRTFFGLSILSLLATLITLTFAFQQKDHFSNNNYAIIFSSQAPVYAEPSLRGDEIFVLHEGTKIEVQETYQNWVKFELSNGIQGWMDKSNVRSF